MKYEFDVGYDRITNFDAPGYEPKEISTFLTRAQEEIVYDILDASANDEKNRKAMSRLRQVIPLTTFTAGNYPNGFLSTLQVYLDSGVGGTIGFTTGTGGTIIDSLARFISSGFRVGDQVTVTGASDSNNNITYSITGVTASTLTVSTQTPVGTSKGGELNVIFKTDPVLRVRNERADITVIAGNFYFGKLDVGGSDEDKIFDVEVDPVDDDFYSANKENPYKKPSIEKIWRIDSADESSKEHEYITDGTFTLTTIHLHIDRKPRAIIVPDTTAVVYNATDGTIDGVWFVDYIAAGASLDCLLDPIIHREIVNRAVKLAYAALQDEKGFQISTVQERQE